MAVEVESTSQVEEFLRVLRKRVWWIIVPFVLLGTLGSSFAVIVPKKYVAMTRVMVRDDEGNQARSGAVANQSEEGKVAKHVIRAPKRLRSVLIELRWPEWQEMSTAERNEYVDEVTDALTVETPAMPPGLGQQVVGIYFAHTEPQKAADFVRLLFEKWKKEVLERGKNKAREVFEKVKQQRSDQQKTYDSLTEQIVRLRAEYEIPPPSANRMGEQPATAHPIFDKIAEDELTKTRLEEEIEALKIAVAEQRDRHAKMEDSILDVQSTKGLNFETQIAFNRREILALNQELTREGYRVLHPRYKEIKRRIADMQEQIEQYQAEETASGTQQTTTINYDKIELADQIERDEIELAKNEAALERLTGQLGEGKEYARNLSDVFEKIFVKGVERRRVEEALTEIESEYQVRLAQQAGIDSVDANPFEVLDPVVTPNKATEPNPILIVLFSIFAGLALGLALAVITEYGKSCFRSLHDITRVMVVPVLGTINGIVTRRQIRRRLFGRLLTGGAILGFVFVVGFVTWAWKYDQRFLSAKMVESIESFREALK